MDNLSVGIVRGKPAIGTWRWLLLASFMAVLFIFAPAQASAADFIVNNTIDAYDNNPGNGSCSSNIPASNNCTLRAAIMEANALPGSHTIILPPGTYTLMLGGAGEDAAATGDLDINTNVKIIGSGGNPDGDPTTTIIDGGAFDRVFDINAALTNSGFNVNLQALTIRNGKIASDLSAVSGGGIRGDTGNSGTIAIYNSVIENNQAPASGGGNGYGGGIYISSLPGGTVNVTKSIIRNNKAYQRGGGILFEGDMNVTVTQSTVDRNAVNSGSAVNEYGGGIAFFAQSTTAPRNVVIDRSTISRNTVAKGYGGGLYMNVPATVTNTTISGNTTSLNGGGAHVNNTFGTATWKSNTVYNNTSTAGSGGGLYSNSSQAIVMHNTIVAGNAGAINGDIGMNAGSLFDALSSNNLIGTGGTGGITAANGNQINVADAKLLPLALFGGTMETHVLGIDSPALDAGNSTFAVGTVDQRGFPRMADSADTNTTAEIDIGAYEAYPSIQKIADQSVASGSLVSIPFHVGDAALGIDSIIVASMDQTKVKDSNISVTGTGSQRTLNITSEAGQAGEVVMYASITKTYNGFASFMDSPFKLTLVAPPDLAIAKTHTGDFAQGQTGAKYTITVTNSGAGATNGTVTVKDTLPAGMTAKVIGGTGWTCSLGTLTCTRSDALAAGASYPAITLTVDVAPNAPASVTNTAVVSGGSDMNNANNTASDVTSIIQTADLVIAKSHTGNFRQGQTGAEYTLIVSNNGTAATTGPVTVVDTLPTGLTAASIAGTGWTCDLGTLTCTRSDALAAGASYEPITVTVNVAPNAPASITNSAAVSGGGEVVTTNNTASDLTVVELAADLTVWKGHSGAGFVQGQSAAYSIVVSNNGAGPTVGEVKVTDTLPAELTAVSITGTGWVCAPGTLTCTRSDVLAAGASYPAITLKANVAVTAPANVTNTVTVAGGGELNTANNTASDAAAVQQLPDLTVVKSHTGDFRQGQIGAQYTITVTNNGTGLTSGTVTVSDTLPMDLTATAISGTGWTCDLGTLSCTRSDVLAAGASYEPITLTVDVAANAATGVTNSAAVSGGSDTNNTNNTALDATSIIQVADLTIAKSHGGNFRQGQIGATYTITVTNNGTGTTTGPVTVVDTLPADLTATAISGTGWTCDQASLTCTHSDALAAGASYEPITVTVNVVANAPASVTNNAAVSGGGEVVTTNNAASDLTVVDQAADLMVTKTHSGNFTQGQSAVYSIVVSNNGVGPTVGEVRLIDTLPADLTVPAISGTGWACDPGTLTCTRSDVLAAGASYPAITLKANVAVTAPANVTNTVTVSGGGELNTANNAASDAGIVNQLPDLTVTKTHTGDFRQGQIGAQYTITVMNNGTGLTSGAVTVSDTLPAGLTATAISGTGWMCDPGALTCTRSDALAAGASYEPITVTVNVAANAAAGVKNTAEVNGGSDTNTGNNKANDATSIIQVADLIITKSHTGNFRQGQTGATYTLKVTNNGTGATAGTVMVVDTLPIGLTATTISGTGWACDPSTLSCTRSDALAVGASYDPITVTVNVTPNAPASVTNSAAVSGGGEVVTTNNTASDLTVVDQAADLTVTKTHSGNFTQGQSAAYSIVVSNNGTGPTVGEVRVIDTLPADLTVTAISGTGWACDPGTLTCTRSDVLSAGASYPAITLTANVAATAPVNVTNTVTVAGGGELNTANNAASDAAIVNQLPDLTVTKMHTGDFRQGQIGAQYTITVTNNGTGLTSGTVNVSDTLPAGLTATAISGTGWTCDLGTLSCTRSDVLAAGASYEPITLIVDVAANAAAGVTNSAVVSGGSDTNNTNNTASDATSIIQVADLVITKIHGGNFRQGQTGAVYTLTVTNNGTGATTGTVSVVDTLPADLTATVISGTGWTCDQASLTCTRSDVLAAGASYEPITVSVNVAANAPVSVTNSATVSGGGEVVTTNNAASDLTLVYQAADLTVTKTHSGNFTQGQSAAYSIVVSNNGAGPTVGAVNVTDTLPAELMAVSITGTGWVCDPSTLTCTRSDALAAGASYPAITLTANVASTAPLNVTNTVTVSGGGELNTANSTASDAAVVNQLPDLTVVKSHTGNFSQGQIGAQYTIKVTNNGTGLTSGAVTVSDTLPAGLTATAISGTGWTCDLGTLSCTRSDALAAGASYESITVTVNVDENASASVTGAAAVSGGGDVNNANNTAQDTVTIGYNVDLSGLTLSNGTLQFVPDITNYAVNVPNSVYGITVTATVYNSTTTLSINSVPVISGQPSAEIPLTVGSNMIAVQVKSQDNAAKKTYTITVTRAANSDASLSELVLSNGALIPAFDPMTLSYTATVNNDVYGIWIAPTLQSSTSALKINGVPALSGQQHFVNLEVGSNFIPIVVTAEDLITTKEYTLTVTRKGSSNATLNGLTISSGGLSPAFMQNEYSYKALVDYSVSSVTVTASVYESHATLTINGVPVVSGQSSAPISLAAGFSTPITILVTAQNGTSLSYTIEVTRVAASSNAELSSLSLSGISLTPVFAPNVTSYSASVPYEVASTSVTAAVYDAQSLINVNGVALASGGTSSPISLAVGTNTLKVQVKAQNGSINHYIIAVTRMEEERPSYGGGGGAPSHEDDTRKEAEHVLVNGQIHDEMAKIITEKQEDRTEIKAMVSDELKSIIADSKAGSTLTVPVTQQADTVTVELSGSLAKVLSDKEVRLKVETPLASYELPAQQLQLGRWMGMLGKLASIADIKLNIVISKSGLEQIKRFEEAAKQQSVTLLLPPIDFHISISYQDKSFEINEFGTYVRREIALPNHLDPNQITTGVVLSPKGDRIRHVPTYVYQKNNQNYAIINSMTNSSYSFIWNSKTFRDIENHWSKDIVNDMGSRLIIDGMDESTFSPDTVVNRAQFAAIVIRGLGLPEGEAASKFQDVKTGDWYSGAIARAAELGLVSGYEDGTFKPENAITREEAIVIVSRAMKLAGYTNEASAKEAEDQLAGFQDREAVQEWAKFAASQAIRSGLIQGDSSNRLNPESSITRAETAVVVYRLLMNAKLID